MTADDVLARTLAEVTETTQYPTTPLATVVTRSREIRHRRRRTTLAAAAAVLVAGGTVALVARPHGGEPAVPEPVAPLPGLARGAAPKIDYLDGDTFVTAAGDRITSRRFLDAAVATPYGDGVLVASRVTSTRPFASLSLAYGGGEPAQRLGCGTPSFAVASGGGTDPAYWLSRTCRPDGVGSLVEGSTSTDTTKGVTYTPVGRVADGVAAYGVSEVLPTGNGAFVLAPDGTSHAVPHLRVPRGATPTGDLVSGTGPNGTDSLVVDATTGDVRWRLPGWSLGRFSASGRYVVGIRSVGPPPLGSTGDVIGIWEAASGHEILRRALPGLTLDSLAAWEGDDSVLVVAEDRTGQQAIIRVDRDGTVTRTTRVVEGLPGSFRLGSTP